MGVTKGTGETGRGEEGQQGADQQPLGGAEDGGPEVSADAIEAARMEAAASETGDRVDELLAEVAQLRRELSEAKSAAERAARRAEIERALTEAGAIDLEIATPLVEEALGSMDEADVGEAVRAVRSAKGFLFRRSASAGVKSAAMAGESGRGVGLEDLAGDARSSGDRSDLLRYLRARRG